MDKVTKNPKISIKQKQNQKKGAVANSNSTLQHPIPFTMSRQVDTHIQMANYFSHIGDLINRPEVNRRGLRDLLWQIQRDPVRNIHPITKEICEQVIHYITEVADNEESETYNEYMDFLSETLEDVPKIILSASPRKRIDLMNLYIDKERLTALEPQHNHPINIARKIIQAAINILFKTTRTTTHTHRIFPDRERDQEVPIQRGQTEEEDNHLH